MATLVPGAHVAVPSLGMGPKRSRWTRALMKKRDPFSTVWRLLDRDRPCRCLEVGPGAFPKGAWKECVGRIQGPLAACSPVL